jgi:hypothetical protein
MMAMNAIEDIPLCAKKAASDLILNEPNHLL